jgi:hypothetical protein
MEKLCSAFEKSSSHAAYQYGATNFISYVWQFISELPTAVQGAEYLKGSQRMGDRRIFLKTFLCKLT